MDNSFALLRESKCASQPEIKLLKREKDILSRELVNDRANMAKLQTRISAKQDQVDRVSATVTFFEEKIDTQDTLIRESEETFKKVRVVVTISDHRERRTTSHSFTPNLR